MMGDHIWGKYASKMGLNRQFQAKTAKITNPLLLPAAILKKMDMTS